METGPEVLFGRQYAHYLLMERIGKGGMAEVFNAFDQHLEKNVALKLILSSRQSSLISKERFSQEAHALAQLSHTNIVKVLDYGEENGTPFLVMEYIKGGTLRDVMAKPLPWDQAASILAPIARALHYVHQNNIVHRDVKPSNILLNDDDQPMLADFGVVMLVEEGLGDQVVTGVGIGTADYLSPEQALGKKVDARADIYSLGVVFYELVTGQKPFNADTDMAVIIKHVTEDFPRPSEIVKDLPDYVEEVVLKAVEKNPKRRFHDMAAFAEVLDQLAKGPNKNQKKKVRGLLKADRLQKKRSQTRPRNPSKSLWAILFPILVILIAAAGGWWWGCHGDLSACIYGLTSGPGETRTAVEAAAALATETNTPVPPTLTRTMTATPTSTPTPRNPAAENTQTPTLRPTKEPVRGTLAGIPTIYPNLPVAETPITNSLKTFTTGTAPIAIWGMGASQVVCWSPDGKFIAVGTSDGVYVYVAGSYALANHYYTLDWVDVLEYSPDGSILTAGLRNGWVLGWSVSSHNLVLALPYQANSGERLELDKTSPVQAVAYSAQNIYLAVGYKNGSLTVWKLLPEAAEVEFTVDQYPTVKGLAFDPQERFLYGANGTSTVTVWDLLNGKKKSQQPQLNLDNAVSILMTVTVSNQSLNQSRYLIAAGPGSAVVFYNLDTDTKSKLGLGNDVTSMDFSAEKQILTTGLKNGEVSVWSTDQLGIPGAKFEKVRSIRAANSAITGMSMSFEGNQFAYATSTGVNIDALDTDGNRPLYESYPAVISLVFSPKNDKLIAAYRNHTVRVWDISSGTVLYEYEGEVPAGEIFTNNGKYFVLARKGPNAYTEGLLHVIALDTGEVVQELAGYMPGWMVKFSADDKLLVVGNPRTATIWDTSVWEKLKILRIYENECGRYEDPARNLLTQIWPKEIFFTESPTTHRLCDSASSNVQALEWVESKNTAIYKHAQGSLLYWNLGSSRSLNLFAQTPNTPTGIDYSYLAISPETGTDIYEVVRVDRVDSKQSSKEIILRKFNGSPVLVLKKIGESWQYSAAISPNNTILAIGTDSGTITLWSGK